ncbi:MAG: antitoxin component YwqK of YwqJK toxin-antitoxin module [Flavobacteriales bacterium]|jgi:antitoxin component YwqK of YwqJK toxin-antitoxin module
MLIPLLIFTIFKINAQEHKEFYDNGQLSSIGNYVNGKEAGEWKSYQENGQLNAVVGLTNGLMTG